MSEFFAMFKLKRLFLLSLFGFFLTGCSSVLPSATPAPVLYDIGVPIKLTSMTGDSNISNSDVIIIPEALVDGVEDSLGIVYRYTNTMDHEPQQYRHARWSQHPAEILRFRMLQHLGEKYPVELSADFATQTSWMLRFTIEEFAQHIHSDVDSSGVVQVRATLGQGGAFVAQKTFRVEVPASSVNVQGAVVAISSATDDVLFQIAQWVEKVIQAQSKKA